ncbi:MAG TPA: thiolase family protein [bacterium]|nr:thiolase family protein [bacterium]
MRDVYVIGSHTIKFGKHLDQGIKELAAITAEGVLQDAGLAKKDVQSVWFSNSGWGGREWQHCIRGQVALRPFGLDAVPITNVENACAGGSTAFHGAWKDVASGLFDVSLAIGAEKLYDRNKYAVFAGFIGGMDAKCIAKEAERLKEFKVDPAEIPREQLEAASAAKKTRKARSIRDRLRDYRDMFVVWIMLGETIGYDQIRKAGITGGDHSPFMDVYGYAARMHMNRFGSTQRQLAAIAAKNHWHSTMNENAQYTFDVSIEDVLRDRLVSYPLTRAMCAPIGDGAASAILASAEVVDRLGARSRAVKVRASVLASGMARGVDEPDIALRAGRIAYETAGLGPGDVNLAEVHDATAFGELHQTEALGFFKEGEGGVRAEDGDTRIGGKLPVNTSGGLISRGHPIGASGLAQIFELVAQLRGQAGKRQVEGARIALAENGGGALGNEEAAMCIHILEKP